MEAELVQRVELTPFHFFHRTKTLLWGHSLGCPLFSPVLLPWFCSRVSGSWTSSGALFPSTTPADLLPAMGEEGTASGRRFSLPRGNPDICPVNSRWGHGRSWLAEFSCPLLLFLFCCFCLAIPHGLWDFHFLTRDWAWALVSPRWMGNFEVLESWF